MDIMDYKIAIIGAREAIQGFALLGVHPVAASSTEEVVTKIKEMKKDASTGSASEPYAIIFVTEDLAEGFTPDDVKYFSKDPLPAIIPLPSHLGSTGAGLKRLKSIVERAVGSDILK